MKIIGFLKIIYQAFDKNRQIHEFKKKKFTSALTIYKFLRKNMRKQGKTVETIYHH